MSAKWRRVQRWDAENLTGPLLPVRVVLHTLSSVWFAVVLLLCISLYGVLASVPIGLIALIPTWAIIVLTALLAVAVLGVGLGFIGRSVVPAPRPGIRFAATVLLGIAGAALGFFAWRAWVWPVLAYDPVTGSGLRLFADFVAAHDNTTLRRLPGVEMTELEFYSWWPLRIVLVLFVVNLTVATIRRIEFTFKNIGVLTVHSGIIVIALGSVYYQSLKKEGDALLRAGMPDAAGKPAMGPPVRGFYDNTSVALWVAQRQRSDGAPQWDPRPLRGVPRYNDYGLDSAPPIAASARVIGPAEELWDDPGRPLSIDVPGPGVDPFTGRTRVDEDIELRIVGYAEYATPVESLIVLDDARAAEIPESRRDPLRRVELLSRLDEGPGRVSDANQPAMTFALRPRVPAGRVSENEAIGVEYTVGMDMTRLADLTSPLPDGTAYGLVVEIPAAAAEDGTVPRTVVPARAGVRHSIGETGWKIGVKQVHPEPPFAIITPGYEGSTSSVAVVEITPPEGDPYDRWVYHRFPEINQDLLSSSDGVRPSRRMAEGSIRVGLVDASKLQVYINEPDPGGPIDAVIREPGGRVRMIRGLGEGETLADVVEKIDLRVSGRFAHARSFEHPMPVPEADRNRQLVGTHAESLLGVEVTANDPTSPTGTSTTVVWVPYLQYLGVDPSMPRTVSLPGGRSLTLQFGRIFHGFPGFAVQLADFEMIAYDHRGAPRDYQSLVRVSPAFADGTTPFEPYEHITKLNAPLTAPFIWSDERPWFSNLALRLSSGLNPNQFKLSQSGWDQQGWTQTQQLTDAGQLPRPYARYTILQVGNNPGIHVIALGSILMAIGIPWAFYIKPLLVRRERDRLAVRAAEKRGHPRTAEQEHRDDTAKEAAGEPVEQA